MHIWARRAISFPLYIAITILLVSIYPVAICALALRDSVVRPRLWARCRGFNALMVYFLYEMIGLLLAAVIWIGLLGGRLGGQTRWLAANVWLQSLWATMFFRTVVVLYGLRVVVEGKENIVPAPFLLFIRHVSVVDTLLAAVFISGPPHRIMLKYVAKQELLWDPCLDVVGRRLPNTFVARTLEKGAHRDAEIDAVRRLAHGIDHRSSVLIYPEGTRFHPRKLAAGLAYLEKAQKSDLLAIARTYQNVLVPRCGGPLALLDAAPHTDILVLEHVGLEGARTLASLWHGDLVGRTLRIRFRRIPAAQIPRDNREQWLFAQWRDTDQWITSFTQPLPNPSLV